MIEVNREYPHRLGRFGYFALLLALSVFSTFALSQQVADKPQRSGGGQKGAHGSFEGKHGAVTNAHAARTRCSHTSQQR